MANLAFCTLTYGEKYTTFGDSLIKQLNDNKLDLNYKVNWEDYKNSILLTQNNTFKKQNTQLFKVISL